MFDSLYPAETKNALKSALPERRSPKGLWDNLGGTLREAPRVSVIETARALEGFKSLIGLSDGSTVETQQLGSPSISTSMGRDIKRFTPDPETTGAASQIVFGFGKVISKALPFGVVGGLPVAALGTGAVDGTAEAQRLQDEGVDAATAAKVGFVRAATTAIGVALPVVGRTALQTAGLVLGGGPASFMVEQQASKMILDGADYAAIARRYDPLDPVGLAVSAMVPGVMGGVLHAARARGARVTAIEAAEAARVAQETNRAQQRLLDEAATADAAGQASVAAARADAEAAARSLQMAEHIRNTGLRPEGDLSSAAIHVDALELVRRQIDAGEPPNVSRLVQQALDEQAAMVAAEAKPAFLRDAADLVALRQTEYPALTPEIGRALEIARTPGFLRSAEDRIFLERMLETGKPPEPQAAPPAVERRAAENVSRETSPPAPTKPGEKAEVDADLLAARDVVKARPDLQVADELTGEYRPAAEIVKQAEAAHAVETKESTMFMAAVICGLGR